MATSERSFGNSEYVEAILKPLRHRLTKWIVLFEVVLFVAGYVISEQGPDPDTLSFTSSVPLEIAAGVVMAAIAVFLALILLTLYAGSVVIHLRSRTGGREF